MWHLDHELDEWWKKVRERRGDPEDTGDEDQIETHRDDEDDELGRPARVAGRRRRGPRVVRMLNETTEPPMRVRRR